jgi:hypothetical protein
MEEQLENQRRGAARVRLPMPIPARLGGTNVVLSDVSIFGAGIQHHVQIPPGENGQLAFRWEKQNLTLDCTLVRSRLEVIRHGETTMRIYHSGLLFNRGGALEALRSTIEKRVTRALERRHADFYGLSPFERAVTDSSGALNLNAIFPLVAERLRGYIRCELRDGKWERNWTRDADQPEEGFTVSAIEKPEDIDLLRKTYEEAGADERHLLRLFAQISVSERSDVPPNRFNP